MSKVMSDFTKNGLYVKTTELISLKLVYLSKLLNDVTKTGLYVTTTERFN